jgi:hypothetical protein
MVRFLPRFSLLAAKFCLIPHEAAGVSLLMQDHFASLIVTNGSGTHTPSGCIRCTLPERFGKSCLCKIGVIGTLICCTE